MTKAIKDHLRDFIAILGAGRRRRCWSRATSSRSSACGSRCSRSGPSSSRPSWRPRRRSRPGQGQTVRVAGVRVGDISKVELRGRQRGGDDGHRPQVPAGLPGRDDPAAAEDRPQGHVPRARPGHPGGGRVRGGRHDPGRQHGARRQPRRGPRAARHRHPRLPEPAADRRRPRASRAAARTSASCSAASARSTATSPGSTREVAKRKENLANLIHNMNIFFGRLGQEDEEIAALIDASNSSLGAIAEPGPRRAARHRAARARR